MDQNELHDLKGAVRTLELFVKLTEQDIELSEDKKKALEGALNLLKKYFNEF